MSCLVFILTDEHPEIRCFIVNQGLNLLFNQPLVLQSPTLKGIVMRDSNEFLTMENLFTSLTQEAATFEEISSEGSRAQVERFA